MRHLPWVFAKVVPHKRQYYDSTGNYGECDNLWWMHISELSDWRREACIYIHEFAEMCLTKSDGVSWADIDFFDTEGEGADHPDPGTLPSAPYYKQHADATVIEAMFCKMLGVDWDDYNKELDNLEYKEKPDASVTMP